MKTQEVKKDSSINSMNIKSSLKDLSSLKDGKSPPKKTGLALLKDQISDQKSAISSNKLIG